MKCCPHCGGPRSKVPSGGWLCKPCRAEASRKRYAEDEEFRRRSIKKAEDARARDPEPSRLAIRKYNYKKRGFSLEEYEDLLQRQGGVCAICGTDVPGTRTSVFCVDHNHATGKIRGLLCSNCNVGIGLLQDDPENLRRAADYLERSHAGV